ncbi:MAG: 30S ribosomal protein S6 [Desulfobulbaceae bacterium]|nr:30S ribosomal protein S6 [Desulfobulbaceae bacterium]
MRRYETIFILRPNAGEEEINKVIGYTTDIVADEKGSIIEMNKWGMKKLAYLIKKESLGYYVYCDYAGTPAAVAEIERKFRIDDAVMKYMTIKTAAAINAEEIQQAIADVSAREASVAAEAEESEAANGEAPTEESTPKVAAAEAPVAPEAE